jgi:hypothetical protein
MSTHATTRHRVRPSRRILLALLAAVLVAGVCWLVLAFASSNSTTERTRTPTVSSADALKSLTAGERRYVQAIAALTPEQIAAAYGPGPSQPTAAERRYLKGLGGSRIDPLDSALVVAATQGGR